MSYIYQNLKKPQNTGSGVAEYILIAPVYDFADGGIKCPEAPFVEQGDEVTIRTAHEFLPDRGFAKFITAPQKNELNAKTIGDPGFQKLDFELKIFVAGSYAEAHETVKNLLNTPLIVLQKDANCDANMWYQLGCDCASAYLKADFSTGTTVSGIKGYAMSIVYQNGYVQLYAAGDPQILGD